MKQISLLRYSLGNFSTIKLDEIAPDSLDFDKIPVYTNPTFKRSMSCARDQFIVSSSLLKEAFLAIRSPSFIEAVRLLSTEQNIPEHFLDHRLFTFSNPKAIERAKLAVKPHLKETLANPTIDSLSGGSVQSN